MPVSVEAQIGISLRSLMSSNGFTSTKIIGYEDNWSDAANYPVQLVRDQNGTRSDLLTSTRFRCSSQGAPLMGSLSTATKVMSVTKHHLLHSTPARYDGGCITSRIRSRDFA